MTNCPDCQQGRLLTMKQTATGTLFLLCEECESAWEDPLSVLNGRGNFDFGQGRSDFTWEVIEKASLEEVCQAGWTAALQEWPSLEKWNAVHLMLTQAFLGAISANVRAISLSFERGQWMIGFTLEVEDGEDIEWLSESLSDFEAMDPSVAPYRFAFSTGSAKIVAPAPPSRLIYLRRE